MVQKSETHGESAQQNISDEKHSFYRMFNIPGADFKLEALSDLAAAQNSINVDTISKLEAGYTYLGQFIAHDISDIKRSGKILSSGSEESDEVIQVRTPSLDLDSLYGSGLQDPDVSYKPNGEFYSENTKKNTNSTAKDKLEIVDLPRGIGESGTLAHIPDLRNDENFIVSRLHALFMNAHNRLLRKHIKESGPGPKAFENTRKELTLIYQLIIKSDFLPKLIPDEMHGLLEEKPKVQTSGGDKEVSPFIDFVADSELKIPVEFSAAAFRFGHSMVQSGYVLVEDAESPGVRRNVDLITLFKLTGRGGLEGGLNNAHQNLDWSKFFNLDNRNSNVFHAHGINTRLQPAMQDLHNEVPGNKDLALRNLLTGSELGLPDAQSCLDYIFSWRPEYKGLSKLLKEKDFPNGTFLDVKQQRRLSPKQEYLIKKVKACGFDKKTPLWTYILMEPGLSESYRHERLGILGSTIVAEVFRALFFQSQTALYNSKTYPEVFCELDRKKKDISEQEYSMKKLYKLACV